MDKKKETEKKSKDLTNNRNKEFINEPTEEDIKIRDIINDNIKIELSEVNWNEIVGLDNVIQSLKDFAISPIKYPELFKGKIKPYRGILLFGPPGTGKTYLAKALCTELKDHFFAISSSKIVNDYLENSHRIIKQLFKLAQKNKPTVIFIDDIDIIFGLSVVGKNENIRDAKIEFLFQMGTDKNEEFIVIGATNVPWGLDPSIRKTFQKKLKIALPEDNSRKLMFKINLGNTYNDLTDEQFEIFGKLTERYSGADIYKLTQDAINEPIKKCQREMYFKYLDDKYLIPCSPSDSLAKKMKMTDINEPEKLVIPLVTFEDFIIQIQKCKPSVKETPPDLCIDPGFTKEFGSEG